MLINILPNLVKQFESVKSLDKKDTQTFIFTSAISTLIMERIQSLCKDYSEYYFKNYSISLNKKKDNLESDILNSLSKELFSDNDNLHQAMLEEQVLVNENNLKTIRESLYVLNYTRESLRFLADKNYNLNLEKTKEETDNMLNSIEEEIKKQVDSVYKQFS